MLTRILSLWLIVCVAAPSPALALKVQTPRETGLEEELSAALDRRQFLKWCGLSATASVSLLNLGQADEQAARDALWERLYRAEWGRPAPRWQVADLASLERQVRPFVRRWEAFDRRWQTMTELLTEHPSHPQLIEAAQALHRLFDEELRIWLKQQGVAVPDTYDPTQTEWLILTTVDYLATQGVVFPVDGAFEIIMESPGRAGVQLMHAMVPSTLFRVVAVPPASAVEVEPWHGVDRVAADGITGFSAQGTPFLLGSAVREDVQRVQTVRETVRQEYPGLDQLGFWNPLAGPFERVDDAAAFALGKLVVEPPWVVRDGVPRVVDEFTEAVRQITRHEEQHVQDHRNADPAIQRIMRLVHRARVQAMLNSANVQEALRQMERRALVAELQVAPRRALMQLLDDQATEFFGKQPPVVKDPEARWAVLAQHDVYQAVVEELQRHPAEYGIDLRRAAPIPHQWQITGQLDQMADLKHPERAERLAAALARQFGLPRPAVPARKPRLQEEHLEEVGGFIALLAAILGIGAVAHWRQQRLAQPAAEPEDKPAAGLEERPEKIVADHLEQALNAFSSTVFLVNEGGRLRTAFHMGLDHRAVFQRLFPNLAFRDLAGVMVKVRQRVEAAAREVQEDRMDPPDGIEVLKILQRDQGTLSKYDFVAARLVKDSTKILERPEAYTVETSPLLMVHRDGSLWIQDVAPDPARPLDLSASWHALVERVYPGWSDLDYAQRSALVNMIHGPLANAVASLAKDGAYDGSETAIRHIIARLRTARAPTGLEERRARVGALVKAVRERIPWGGRLELTAEEARQVSGGSTSTGGILLRVQGTSRLAETVAIHAQQTLFAALSLSERREIDVSEWQPLDDHVLTAALQLVRARQGHEGSMLALFRSDSVEPDELDEVLRDAFQGEEGMTPPRCLVLSLAEAERLSMPILHYLIHERTLPAVVTLTFVEYLQIRPGEWYAVATWA